MRLLKHYVQCRRVIGSIEAGCKPGPGTILTEEGSVGQVFGGDGQNGFRLELRDSYAAGIHKAQ